MNLPPVLRQRYLDANGNPLAGGLLYTYQAGTTTPQATYTDSGGGTPNANPIVLDANGEAAMWLDPTLSYKFVLKNSSEVTQWTVDNVIGILTSGSVVTASLADSAVTTAKLADDSVTADKLKDSPSTDGDRAVTTNHIRDSAVTLPKLPTLVKEMFSQGGIPKNYSIACSVASSALTIALKDASGSDASSTSPIYVQFRNATAATGTPVTRTVTGALSTVISSGSTAGHSDGGTHYIYVYLLDNAGTVELAWSSSLFDDGSIQSSTTESNSDSGRVLYSTTGRSNVAIRLIGRLKSTQTTAGTWNSLPTEISLVPLSNRDQTVHARYSTNVAQTVQTATLVDFEDKANDTRNAVTTGASWKFTAPEAGVYAVSASLRVGSTTITTGQTIQAFLYKNGSQLLNGIPVYGNGTSQSYGAYISGHVILAAGDYVDIRVTLPTSTSLNGTTADNWVDVTKVHGFA